MSFCAKRTLCYGLYRSFFNGVNFCSKAEQNVSYSGNKIIRLDFKDKILSEVMLKVKSKKMREKSKLILIEGSRLLKDMMSSGQKPSMVFFSRLEDIQNFEFDSEIKLYKTPYKDLQLWSDVVTSSGILAISKIPEILPVRKTHLPVTLICDQVREPGNLGAIFRNAAGAGIKQIILTKGCVDLWEPKVLRAAAGTHFRLTIYSDITWEEINERLDTTAMILLASNEPSSSRDQLQPNISDIPLKKYFEIDYSRNSNTILVMGGETMGLSKSAYEFASFHKGMRLNIPLDNDVESLNTASASSVILFEIKKQFQEMISRNCLSNN